MKPFVTCAVLLLSVGCAHAQYLDPVGQQALESARSGTIVRWDDPDGRSGTFVPQPAFQNAAGEICREFQQAVVIGGRQEQAWGTACRNPDGSWRLQRAATAEAPLPAPRYVPAPAPIYIPAPPPPVIYSYRPAYFPPGYYYSRPYYPGIIPASSCASVRARAAIIITITIADIGEALSASHIALEEFRIAALSAPGDKRPRAFARYYGGDAI